MGFFNKIFSKAEEEVPEISFGRNYERTKTEDQLLHWDKAIESFESERYFDSIEHFCQYMIDPDLKLLEMNRDSENITFSIVQGSRVIVFEADQNHFRAKAEIATMKEENIGLLRRLLESSYKLIYGRYCLQSGNTISIVFDGYLQEASPHKLFEGLKEISLRADKEDDLLLEDFDVLEKLEPKHILPIKDSEKDVKFKFFQLWVQRALDSHSASGLDMNRYPGAYIYLLLSTMYKIDYLLLPEGKLMDMIENAHKQYFDKNEYDLGNKAIQLEKFFLSLKEIGKDKFTKELYVANHLFPITQLISTQDLAKNIEVELSAMNWYYANRHFGICKAICDYIVASSFFNHTLPGLSHELMHLYFEMTEPDFFKELGFKNQFTLNDPKTSASLLEDKVREILKSEWDDISAYEPYLKFNSQSDLDLLLSYLRFIQNFHY